MSNFYRNSNHNSNSKTFLSFDNLNKLPDHTPKKIIEDDIYSESSYTSVESFIKSTHCLERMYSRHVSQEQISIVLKKGHNENNQQ